jgi:hypothetical protein
VNGANTDIAPADLEQIFGELTCGGRGHPTSTNGHIESQPGTYMLICKNCGPRVVLCEARVAFLRGTRATVQCEFCGLIQPTREWRFERI